MLALIARFRRGTRGQGLVEFALILPMIAFVMFSFWELSRAWNTYQVVTRAGREAARAYVVDNGINTQAQVEAVADNILASAALDPSRANITHPNGFALDPDDQYVLRIEYPFDFWLLRAIHGLTGSQEPFRNLTLARNVGMRVE